MIILLTYLVITTIIGIYWLIKNPPLGHDQVHFSLFEIVAYIFPSALIAWAIVPVLLLHQVKLKR